MKRLTSVALIALMTGFIAPGHCQDRPVSAPGSPALATLPTWIPTGNLNTPRGGHTATLLTNGNVLVVGGQAYFGHHRANLTQFLGSAELYDIATGAWSVTGSLDPACESHSATLLHNGQVVVSGRSWTDTLRSCTELYDPATGTWSPTGNPAATFFHVALLLPDGRVLIYDYFHHAELYDPVAGTWSPAASPTWPHNSATLLQDGNVLFAGGNEYSVGENEPPAPTSKAELYDPISNTWKELGTAIGLSTATLLANGKVLMVDASISGCVPPADGSPRRCAALFDPATETFVDTGDPIAGGGASFGNPIRLSDGKVLFAGDGGIAQLYDPDTGTWNSTSGLHTGRIGHTATLLPNGHVLVAGGFDIALRTLNSAELYGVPPKTVSLIEYFHAAFGHYFITSNSDEISKLDRGTIAGWSRTGFQFNAYAAAGAGASPVCRFFSTAFDPKSSHFYTPFPAECATVQANPDWSLENAAAFYVAVPAGDGSCAAGLTPVYRLYNNGQDGAPNHRYMTSLARARQMIAAQGWSPEGLGQDGVEMCSPR